MGLVINSFIKLVGKTIDPVPSRTTVLNMNVERLVMSQNQVNESLTNQQNLALFTDETTKFGSKYFG